MWLAQTTSPLVAPLRFNSAWMWMCIGTKSPCHTAVEPYNTVSVADSLLDTKKATVLTTNVALGSMSSSLVLGPSAVVASMLAEAERQDACARTPEPAKSSQQPPPGGSSAFPTSTALNPSQRTQAARSSLRQPDEPATTSHEVDQQCFVMGVTQNRFRAS